jgi:hypothetical protein
MSAKVDLERGLTKEVKKNAGALYRLEDRP